jgi:predicted SAM-dependent methyltransferase
MKLNMGCGHNKKEGWVNVDLSAECQPDIVCDLESLPWPWESDSVDEVLFNHSLEHIGQSSRTFLGMMKELYRVCRNGARININVPHPRHDNFINDPTHVRIITPEMLSLFDRKANDEIKRLGAANTPLAHYLDVDFFVESKVVVLDEPYASQHAKKLLSDADVDVMCREWNNVASEYRIVLVARKTS